MKDNPKTINYSKSCSEETSWGWNPVQPELGAQALEFDLNEKITYQKITFT